MVGTLYFHCRGPRFNPSSNKRRLVARDQKRHRNGKERAVGGELQVIFVLQLNLLSSSCYGKLEVGSGPVRGRLGTDGRQPCLSFEGDWILLDTWEPLKSFKQGRGMVRFAF